MGIFTVPCTPNGSACWTQRTALDGSDFVLSFDWNQRTGLWFFSVADQDAVPIVSGRALTTGTLLLKGVRDPRRPRGELVVEDTTLRNDADPAFDDLGARFRVTYVDAAELGR